MRAIKFRAWEKEKSRLLDVISVNIDDKSIMCKLPFGGGKWLRDGKYELMQFTGLKDKNSKEIYEGDIVSYMEDLSNPQEVYYSTGYFYPLATFNTETAVTKLGNIYENPELLPTPTSKE